MMVSRMSIDFLAISDVRTECRQMLRRYIKNFHKVGCHISINVIYRNITLKKLLQKSHRTVERLLHIQTTQFDVTKRLGAENRPEQLHLERMV